MFIYLSQIKKLKVCSDNLNSKSVKPDDKEIEENSFDIIFDTVGLELTRQTQLKLQSLDHQ